MNICIKYMHKVQVLYILTYYFYQCRCYHTYICIRSQLNISLPASLSHGSVTIHILTTCIRSLLASLSHGGVTIHTLTTCTFQSHLDPDEIQTESKRSLIGRLCHSCFLWRPTVSILLLTINIRSLPASLSHGGVTIHTLTTCIRSLLASLSHGGVTIQILTITIRSLLASLIDGRLTTHTLTITIKSLLASLIDGRVTTHTLTITIRSLLASLNHGGH